MPKLFLIKGHKSYYDLVRGPYVQIHSRCYTLLSTLSRSFYSVYIIYKSGRGLPVGPQCCQPFPASRYCSPIELDSPRSEHRYLTQIQKTFIHYSDLHVHTNTHHHAPVLRFTPIASDRQAMQKFSPFARTFLWIVFRLGEGNNSLMVCNWKLLVSY